MIVLALGGLAFVALNAASAIPGKLPWWVRRFLAGPRGVDPIPAGSPVVRDAGTAPVVAAAPPPSPVALPDDRRPELASPPEPQGGRSAAPEATGFPPGL